MRSATCEELSRGCILALADKAPPTVLSGGHCMGGSGLLHVQMLQPAARLLISSRGMGFIHPNLGEQRLSSISS